MLPFLKLKDEGGAASPVETAERKPDDPESYDMLDAVAEDILAALETKDKGMLKSALQALCEHIQDNDEQQDQEMGE